MEEFEESDLFIILTVDECSDGLIVNLGRPEDHDQPVPYPKELDRWHCDGDVGSFLTMRSCFQTKRR